MNIPCYRTEPQYVLIHRKWIQCIRIARDSLLLAQCNHHCVCRYYCRFCIVSWLHYYSRIVWRNMYQFPLYLMCTHRHWFQLNACMRIRNAYSSVHEMQQLRFGASKTTTLYSIIHPHCLLRLFSTPSTGIEIRLHTIDWRISLSLALASVGWSIPSSWLGLHPFHFWLTREYKLHIFKQRESFSFRSFSSRYSYLFFSPLVDCCAKKNTHKRNNKHKNQ